MITALLGSVAFALGSAIPGLLLAVAIAYSRASVAATPWDDMLVAWYIVGLSAVLSTAAFLIVTALSGYWRRLARRRAMLIGAALGLISPFASLALLMVTAAALRPLFQSVAMPAAIVFYALPGFGLGLAAPWVARAWSRLSA
jgi:hypothetical protein